MCPVTERRRQRRPEVYDIENGVCVYAAIWLELAKTNIAILMDHLGLELVVMIQ